MSERRSPSYSTLRCEMRGVWRPYKIDWASFGNMMYLSRCPGLHAIETSGRRSILMKVRGTVRENHTYPTRFPYTMVHRTIFQDEREDHPEILINTT